MIDVANDAIDNLLTPRSLMADSGVLGSMTDDEPLEFDVETSNATALGVSMLLEQTAKGLQETDGTETRRYSLTLTLKEE